MRLNPYQKHSRHLLHQWALVCAPCNDIHLYEKFLPPFANLLLCFPLAPLVPGCKKIIKVIRHHCLISYLTCSSENPCLIDPVSSSENPCLIDPVSSRGQHAIDQLLPPVTLLSRCYSLLYWPLADTIFMIAYHISNENTRNPIDPEQSRG
jgi:hypothetical protein